MLLLIYNNSFVLQVFFVYCISTIIFSGETIFGTMTVRMFSALSWLCILSVAADTGSATRLTNSPRKQLLELHVSDGFNTGAVLIPEITSSLPSTCKEIEDLVVPPSGMMITNSCGLS